ncbi:Proline iminopeptidase [Luteitalea pratensis]|uniref:Proline iminopeptidase n=1 Tax=Luteitalea pratensis TaxID=1855912 RepID=A0A143PNG3_LUTPR|nr:alpha/beta hydrolase [Luteitalea pratensis]AMY09314.1 Proline iminopeptidase [Luteitalea pratensis]
MHRLLTTFLVVLAAWPLAAQRYPDAQEDGHFTGADDVRLFYRKLGTGKDVVVMLHGGPGGTTNNGEEMAPLAKGRTLIFYDQRGGGRSDLVSDPTLLTANHHVRDLEALRQYFRLEQVSLLGISWGSGLAALYTAEHPARVSRLLLVSPMPVARFPFGPERREKIDAVLGRSMIVRRDEVARRIPTASDDDVLALCREQLSIGMSAYLVDQRHVARVADRCKQMPPAAIRNRPNVARAGMASLGDWDFRPLLTRLTMPALVFEGAKTNVPLNSTREWVSALPHARLLLIPDAGHEFWAEKPDEFVAAADTFLRGEYPKDAEVVK